MKALKLIGLWLVGFSLIVSVTAGIGCRDDNGNPVDWFIVYKIPVLAKSKNPNFNKGYGYASLDPSHSSAFKISSFTLDQDSGYIGNTLNQVYKGAKSSVGWLMYNDQKPSGDTTTTYGHTKGVIGFDGTSGFWLIHSVPRWPVPYGEAYSFPEFERIYGQNFLCISYDFARMNDVGYQLLFSRPWIYDSNIPSSLSGRVSNLNAVLNGEYQRASNASILEIHSQGNVAFHHMAKNSKWNNDIYESLVAPYIDDGVFVETWMRPYFGSFCAPGYQYPVVNVNNLALGSDVAFGETNDHSKWAISYTDTSWVCVGDINHQQSQFTRAGGTMCFQNQKVRGAYLTMIVDSDNCK